MTGRIMGIDTHSFTVRNRETGQIERRRMQWAVIISYRVKVLVPKTGVWMSGHELGEKLDCRVLSVGPKRCLVECGGRDMSLSQKDLTYIAAPDLRERYHPGQTLDCVLKEYNRQTG